MITTLVRQLAAAVAPPRCGCCGEPCEPKVVLCGRCRAALARARPLIESRSGRRRPGGGRLAVRGGRARARPRPQVRPAAGAGARSRLKRSSRPVPHEELRGTVVPVPAAPLAVALARIRSRRGDRARSRHARLPSIRGLPAPRRTVLARWGGSGEPGSPIRRGCGLVGPAPARVLLVDDVSHDRRHPGRLRRGARAGGCARVVALTLAPSWRCDPKIRVAAGGRRA